MSLLSIGELERTLPMAKQLQILASLGWKSLTLSTLWWYMHQQLCLEWFFISVFAWNWMILEETRCEGIRLPFNWAQLGGSHSWIRRRKNCESWPYFRLALFTFLKIFSRILLKSNFQRFGSCRTIFSEYAFLCPFGSVRRSVCWSHSYWWRYLG